MARNLPAPTPSDAVRSSSSDGRLQTESSSTRSPSQPAESNLRARRTFAPSHTSSPQRSQHQSSSPSIESARTHVRSRSQDSYSYGGLQRILGAANANSHLDSDNGRGFLIQSSRHSIRNSQTHPSIQPHQITFSGQRTTHTSSTESHTSSKANTSTGAVADHGGDHSRTITTPSSQRSLRSSHLNSIQASSGPESERAHRGSSNTRTASQISETDIHLSNSSDHDQLGNIPFPRRTLRSGHTELSSSPDSPSIQGLPAHSGMLWSGNSLARSSLGTSDWMTQSPSQQPGLNAADVPPAIARSSSSSVAREEWTSRGIPRRMAGSGSLLEGDAGRSEGRSEVRRMTNCFEWLCLGGSRSHSP